MWLRKHNSLIIYITLICDLTRQNCMTISHPILSTNIHYSKPGQKEIMNCNWLKLNNRKR